jgi:hypothetical protein
MTRQTLQRSDYFLVCVRAPLDRDDGIPLKFGNIHNKLRCIENKER